MKKEGFSILEQGCLFKEELWSWLDENCKSHAYTQVLKDRLNSFLDDLEFLVEAYKPEREK